MSFGHTGVILDAGEGKTVSAVGNSYTYKASGKETGGGYALIEIMVVGDGPPPHIHKTEEEAFYVLEGSLNVLVGEHTIKANAGAFVLVPRGTVHTFSKIGTSAKILTIIPQQASRNFLRRSHVPLTLRRSRLWHQSITSKLWGQLQDKAGTIINDLDGDGKLLGATSAKMGIGIGSF
jgi:quercetin dioxygenase-like cupin family protein